MVVQLDLLDQAAVEFWPKVHQAPTCRFCASNKGQSRQPRHALLLVAVARSRLPDTIPLSHFHFAPPKPQISENKPDV